jgi:hypothetical protein
MVHIGFRRRFLLLLSFCQLLRVLWKDVRTALESSITDHLSLLHARSEVTKDAVQSMPGGLLPLRFEPLPRHVNSLMGSHQSHPLPPRHTLSLVVVVMIGRHHSRIALMMIGAGGEWECRTTEGVSGTSF